MELTIRPALHEEDLTLQNLSVVAIKHNNSPDLEIDFQRIAARYHGNASFITDHDSWYDKNRICLVAEVEEFETDYPLFGCNGKQLCGYIHGKLATAIKHRHFYLQHFYAVKCAYNADFSYPVGHILMSELVATVQESDARSIMVEASRNKSACWYNEKALFDYKNSRQQDSEIRNLVLPRSKFAASLENLAL